MIHIRKDIKIFAWELRVCSLESSSDSGSPFNFLNLVTKFFIALPLLLFISCS